MTKQHQPTTESRPAGLPSSENSVQGRWGRIITLAGLVVLGVAPWAPSQQPLPNLPAYCPPLTAFAHPTLFDLFSGTAPIRFPYG
jgi:hypothetical protein